VNRHPRPTSSRSHLDAVDQGIRFADEGACVPWAAMAAIERATRDAADRRAAAALVQPDQLGWVAARIRSWIGRLPGRHA
jgi:hypothetical protein